MDAKKTSERLARQLEMVRQTKVKKIKERLSKGNYKVENVVIAKALFIAN